MNEPLPKPVNKLLIWLILTILSFMLAAVIGYVHRNDEPPIHTLSGATMGTTYSVSISEPPKHIDLPELGQKIEQLLEQINAQMSTYRPDSELSRFNQSRSTAPFNVSTATAKVVTEALRVGRLTDGALDVTLGPVVNLWGFGPQAVPEKIPTETDIAAAMAETGLNHLQSGPDYLVKSNPELYVDLSSLAKGYGVDQLAELLNAHGVENYLVEIGGEVRVHGQGPGKRKWRIAVEHPVSGVNAQPLVVEPIEGGVATSGDYRNYYEQDGQRYSHLIDPANGRPISHKLVSVTVIHASTMTADALATALMIMGPDKALAFAQEHRLAVTLVSKRSGHFETQWTEQFGAYRR